jgi:hypothetical protein
MPPRAPLQISVEINLLGGPAAGERRFRLSHLIEMPGVLHLSSGLPIEGEQIGKVRFTLPTLPSTIAAAAKLIFDPEKPEHGCRIEMLDLSATEIESIRSYIEQRLS